jgi:hypothetical protein
MQRRQEEFDNRRRVEFAKLRLEGARKKCSPSYGKRANYSNICCQCDETTEDVDQEYVVVCEAECLAEIHQRCLDPSLSSPAERLEAWYCPDCVVKEGGAGAGAAAGAAGATHTGKTTTSTDATHAPSTPSSHSSQKGREMEMEMEMEMEREGMGMKI